MAEARRGAGPGAAASMAVAAAACIGAPPAAAQPADDAGLLAEGRALFASGATPPCATCHTLKDANASGAIGPALDELRPDAARVAAALKTGIGAMPSYAATLGPEQIDLLARYVAAASRR